MKSVKTWVHILHGVFWDKFSISEAPDYTKKWGYPPALAKACVDPFDYAIGIRGGMVLRFRECEAVSREWVHISDFDLDPDFDPKLPYGFNFERGIDVRVFDILWIADAPRGS